MAVEKKEDQKDRKRRTSFAVICRNDVKPKSLEQLQQRLSKLSEA